MTIQNIDDVMDRIMSLNRNLTEDSLRTLLSASGWDRDDIREGIKIFESRNKEKVSATPFNTGLGVDKNVTADKKPTTPAPKPETTPTPKDEHALDDTQYSLNLKNRTANKTAQGTIEHEDFVSPSMRDKKVEKEDQEKIQIANVRNNANIPVAKEAAIPVISSEKISPIKKFENKIAEKIDDAKASLDTSKKAETKTEKIPSSVSAATPTPTPPPISIPIIPKNPKTGKLEDLTKNLNHHKTNFAKLLFYILLLIVLLFVVSYLLIPTFKNFINQEVFHNQATLKITVPNGGDKSTQTGNINPNVTSNPNQNNTAPNQLPNQALNPGPTSSPIISNQNPNSQNPNYDQALSNIEQEIADLKQKLTEYKNAKQETQTVVKYISQRGPAGEAGRGIAYLEATSTGFIVHYTDNTQQTISYASTTKLENLNAETVCFRDVPDPNSTSTATQFDICLNRQSLLNLLTNH